LSPEVIFDAPLVDEPLPTQAAPAIEPKLPTPVVAPAVAPPPSVAPLNLAQQFQPHFEVHGHWDADLAATPGSLVVCPAPSDLQISEPAPLIELKLVPLPIAPVAAIEVPALPTPTFRVDPPHAAAAKPHAKFAPPAAEPTVIAEPIQQPQGYFGDSTEEQHDDAAIAQPQQSTPKELDFADRESATEAAEPSAKTDSTPELVAPNHWNELASPESSPQTTNTDCVPVWEVDRFQWPVTVERLVSDKDGYFAQASGRLLAAVRDGLRTLAISGSRRGEGRTTLALALARSAAKAGIQVAVIDADFARPQLAARIGLEVNHGWQDAATGLVPLSETAVRSLADNVTVLPLEASAARAGLSMADPRVTATLRAAAATFELVIVDLGPLAVGDEPLFPDEEACPLDAAIVVRDLRYASAAESENVGQRLMAAGVEAVGIAENFVVEEELPVTSV